MENCAKCSLLQLGGSARSSDSSVASCNLLADQIAVWPKSDRTRNAVGAGQSRSYRALELFHGTVSQNVHRTHSLRSSLAECGPIVPISPTVVYQRRLLNQKQKNCSLRLSEYAERICRKYVFWCSNLELLNCCNTVKKS